MFWKRTEFVAEQLLASQEGIFFVTFIVSNCNDLTVILLKMYKAATVLSALMKMCTVPCHDRGHINIMVLYRSAQILCTFCQVRPVRRFQHHLKVHVMSAIQQLRMT